MLNKKAVRIGIGIVFLIFLVVSFVPNFYRYTSSDGIINARTTTLKSPIEGVLSFPNPMKCGVHFKEGEVIGQVVNNRINKSLLHELMTEKTTQESRIANLQERIAEYTALNERLTQNLEKYKLFSANQLKQMIKQTDDKLAQEKAEHGRAIKEFEANKLLVERQAVKKREFETSEASHLKSSARISEMENRLSELRNSLEAVESGVFLGDGHNDVPYSRQRMDQLVIEISLAKTALGEAKNRIAGIDKQIDVEQKRLAKAERFEITAPFNALVWRLSSTEGSTVVIDSELLVLLDCSSTFVDIAVSESQFSNIKPGSEVEYRLIGDMSYHKAKIFALRGSGSELADKNLAANLSKDPKREFRVWAAINPNDVDSSPENFFQVGRRVEVKLSRKWKVVTEVVRFFNVF